jgi:hypothetical protein
VKNQGMATILTVFWRLGNPQAFLAGFLEAVKNK